MVAIIWAKQFSLLCKVFSGEDRGPIQRRFKVVKSEELPPPADLGGDHPAEALLQGEAGGEEDGHLPQELLQEVRDI